MSILTLVNFNTNIRILDLQTLDIVSESNNGPVMYWSMANGCVFYTVEPNTLYCCLLNKSLDILYK